MIVTALCDTGTSTRDLCKYVNTASQTDESGSNDSSNGILDNVHIPESESAEDMSRKRTAMERDNRDVLDQIGECEKALVRIDKRCDNAEKKMAIVEHEHEKEMAILKSEQSNIRGEIKSLKAKLSTQKSAANEYRAGPKTKPNKRSEKVTSVPDAPDGNGGSWDPELSTVTVMTQDSQGDPVLTRATPIHTISGEEPERRVQRGVRTLREYFPAKPEGYETGKKADRKAKDVSSTSSVAQQQSADMRSSCAKCDCSAASTSKQACPNTQAGVIKTGNRVSNSADMLDDQHNDLHGNMPDFAPSERKSAQSEAQSKQAGSPVKEKYSKVVTRNGWTTPTGNNNGKNSPEKAGQRSFPMIASLAENDTKEYLVRGLSVKNFRTHRDLEQSVKHYCNERNVATEYQRVITFKNDKKTVGCKFTIRTSSARKILSGDFWPKGVKVREWYDKKPSERDRFFESSDDSDEKKSN